MTEFSPDAILALKKEMAQTALAKQFDYGKRVLASLLTAHLGGLLLISQTGYRAPDLFAAAGGSSIPGEVVLERDQSQAWASQFEFQRAPVKSRDGHSTDSAMTPTPRAPPTQKSASEGIRIADVNATNPGVASRRQSYLRRLSHKNKNQTPPSNWC